MARLPQPGGDEGSWGAVLNDYLSQVHESDGTLKSNIVTADALAPNAVDETVLGVTGGADGQVLTKDINSTTGLAWTTVTGTGSVPDATSTVKGVIQLAGDLSGTATSPTIATGAVTSAKIADETIVDGDIAGSAAIAQSKISGLSGSLAAKESAITAGTTGQYYRGDKTWQTLDKSSVGLSSVDNTADINKPISTAVQAALNAKATDSAVVHLAGNETIGGVKTFSLSPIVPSPSFSSEVANKSYVDSVASSGSPDATSLVKGIIQLAGDLGGTATVPVIANNAITSAKIADATIVDGDISASAAIAQSKISGLTGALAAKESTVTSGTTSQYYRGDKSWQTLDKSSVGLSNVDNTSDANKPVSSATQTALNAKANNAITLTGATSLTGGGDLSANRTLSLVGDSAAPGASQYYGTNAGGSKGWYPLSGGGSSVGYQHIILDDMAGADDDAKLTAAISLQQSTAGMPPIVLGARNHAFNQVRTLYSGLKLIGQSTGPKNLEQDPNFVTSRITLGASLSSAASSWWVTPGGNLFDIYMADFAVQGSAGSSKHQFIDVTTGSLYACQFHSLAFNFMRSVFGRKDRKCLVTQVVFSGHWTANNLWDTQFNLGGADCQLWMGGYINIGPSSSPAQTGTYADGDYQMIFDNLTKTDIGYIFTSSLNGWRGIKVSGNSGHGLRFFGGSYEGYKSTNDNLAAPGTVIRLEGGSGAFFGPSIGQAMQSPDAAEGGPVHMTGGEWSFYSPNFYRSPMAETQPCIYHTGGRLLVQGATRHEGETWTNRPRYFTTSSGPNSTEDSFYCPDMSMITV